MIEFIKYKKELNKAVLHLLIVHKIFDIKKVLFHNCWVHYRYLTKVKVFCMICETLYEAIESRPIKKFFKTIHLTTIELKFERRNIMCQDKTITAIIVALLIFMDMFVQKWTEKRFNLLYTEYVTVD